MSRDTNRKRRLTFGAGAAVAAALITLAVTLRRVVGSKPAEAAAATVLSLPDLVSGIPAPPDPALDPFLGAAARCFARHGISRTSVQDIAAEPKVNRATVYRHFNSLFERFDTIELLDENPEWRPNLTLRGLAALPVSVS